MTADLVTTGEFSRLTRLTRKALRHYDEIGLLRPEAVDDSNGYRLYSPAQVEKARLIGLLRGAAMSLGEIGELLSDLPDEPGKAIDRLGRHRNALEGEQASRRVLIGHITHLLRKDDTKMFPIETRHVEALKVLSIQRRLHAHELDDFIAQARADFYEHLSSSQPTGPFTVIFHGLVDHESDGPVEAVLGCPPNVEPTDTIGVRTEPAHDEVFTTITKQQWEFPAILAAYDAVACSPEAATRHESRLSTREVYLADPDQVGPDDLICDIAFPIASPA